MSTFPKPTIKNVTLARLRDSLLPKLMRGEVRVKDAQSDKKGWNDD